MKVSVFGGSQPKPGQPAYQQAVDLGNSLAQEGHSVLTGGYIGSMEAVSRGAHAAGGHVIGVTCEEIEAWRVVKPNAWIHEERRFVTLLERLNELVTACDAAIALPGGPGTLTEISLAWNLMIVEAMPHKPLILLGAGWKGVMGTFFASFEDFIPQSQRDLIQYAPGVLDVLELLTRAERGKTA